MTIKYLSGAYPGGYTLAAAYTGLDIEATATVGGTGVAVHFNAAVQNLGAVEASGTANGVVLTAGGSVTNGAATYTAALIQGADGVLIENGPATIANFGTILGSTGVYGCGVRLDVRGMVTNGSALDTTALIEGDAVGVFDHNRPATIGNFGTILGTGDYGVRLGPPGGFVTNGSASDATALISGAGGISVDLGSTTITNFGTIAGTKGVALEFRRADDLLKVEAGSVFKGKVEGDFGILDLASGVETIDSLSGGDIVISARGRATTFTAFGTLQIAKGARFTLVGDGVIANNQTQTLTVDGALVVAGDLVVNDTLTGGGTVALEAGATVEVDGAAPKALTVVFAAANTTLELKTPSAFAATIASFASAGTVDLLGIAADSAVLGAGDTLVVTDKGAAVATLQLNGNFGADTFTATSDGHGGTLIGVNRVHALIAAAAALGAGPVGAYAPLAVHASEERLTLTAPRVQLA